MIDVVFQLIIFFMYTSTFATMVRTPVDLPELSGESEPKPDDAPVVIDITREGLILLSGSEASLEEIVRVVRAEADTRFLGDIKRVEVLVRADENVLARHVHAVVRALTGAGVERWSTGSETPAGAG